MAEIIEDTNPAEPRLWYVLRDLRAWNTRQPAYKCLAERGLQVFTPMQSIIRTGRSGRRERLEVPYIHDLLFVCERRSELDPIVAATDKLQYRFVRGAGPQSAMTVPTAEMDRFIAAVTTSDTPIYYKPSELTPDMIGREIIVNDGPLSGRRGRLLKMQGSKRRRLIVEIPGLVAAAIEVNPDFIQLI